ncbi:hypothetical protein J6Q66_04790 [bacterium]|nr:hypothetical protein [bacterium]
MKKFLFILFLVFFFSGVCFAATYKINKSGKVVSNQNKTTQNVYNIYSAQDYTNSNRVNQNSASVVEIVMDYSGSMVSIIDVAKQTMSQVVAQIPTDIQLGLRVFGQEFDTITKKSVFVKQVTQSVNKKGKKVYKLNVGKHKNNKSYCMNSDLVTPIKKANAQELIKGMNSVEIGGATPMVYALERAAYEDFNIFSRALKKKIILITDGEDTCGGDACSFAKTLMSQRSDITVDVVLVSSSSRKMKCLVEKTNGKIYSLNDVSELPEALSQSINGVQTEEFKEQKFEFLKF